jgi:Asp/Glu/hydantoin racemase
MTNCLLQSTEAMQMFSAYMKVTGMAHLGPEPGGDPELIGKRLGLINGASWITLWSNFFGRLYLPGVHLINVGNEAIQINFMAAFQAGLPTPPQSNIDAFVRYARDLVELAQVDAVLITCSTMNRSFPLVQKALDPYHVPVVPIDGPMMERAVIHGGRILVVATGAPTVGSTQALLREKAAEMGCPGVFSGLVVEEGYQRLARGDIDGHNRVLAEKIRDQLAKEEIGCVVLAQLSMSIFLLSYPDPVSEFGVPILTSAQCGFEHVRTLLVRR